MTFSFTAHEKQSGFSDHPVYYDKMLIIARDKYEYPVHRMKSGCGSILFIASMAETTSAHGASQL